MELLEIVQERQMKESEPACPYCGSTDLLDHGTSTTLVGYIGDVDPNHQWTEMKCKGCKVGFTREEKSGNVWYTDAENVVLMGIPTCFESYIYHCVVCGGPVKRKYKALDGGDLPTFDVTGGRKAQILSTKIEAGKSVNQYRVFYICDDCGHGGEVDNDYLRND